MQNFKCRSNIVLAAVNKNLYRSIAVAASTTQVYDNAKPWKDIPGPNSLPVIGAMHHFLPGGIFRTFNGIELANKLYNTYGPIVKLDNVIGRDPILYLYDPEGVEQILRGENWSPIRPGFATLEYYRKNFKTDAKKGKYTGLLTEHGDQWREMRSIVNPIILNPKVAQLYTSAIDGVAKDMVARLKSLRDDNNKITTKFSDEMNLWSIESTGVVLLGYRMGCFNSNLPDDSPIKKLIECSHEEFKLIQKLDFSPTVWKLFSTWNFKRAMALYEQHETLTKYFITEAMKEYNNKNNTKEKSILEKILEINEDYAFVIATDLLFAGIETTSNAMTSVLYLLAVNPEKQNKLREELQSNDEKKTYLKACLKEALRLMPVTSSNRRLTTKEYIVRGYKIPAKTFVYFGHKLMSAMEEHYPRSNEFLPERWLVEKDHPLYYKQAHSFASSPFGFGVRSCIARRLAELMMECFTTRVVKSFQVEWSGPPPTVNDMLINFIIENYNFVLNDASK